MIAKDLQGQCDIGMVGLGVMGRNLLLNMADHGFRVAGLDKDQAKVDSLHDEALEKASVQGTTSIKAFIALLKKPRAIMLLVPAGAPVDDVINELVPYLVPNDLIIDGGNSHFTDTDLRSKHLLAKGIQFLGVGISGGETGARRGPSIMPGGPKEAYERIRPILEAVAAKVDGEPCVAYLGPASAGHYVKMVHNGIEYGLMQLIAETYDVLKHILKFNNQQLHDVYESWNAGDLNSYLLEITTHIFAKRDEKNQKYLIDEIKAVAKQKGTGMWTSQNAMTLQVPIPTIDMAVAMRDLSGYVNEREQASQLYRVQGTLKMNKDDFLKQLQQAFYAGMIIVYAQGFALLYVASRDYNYHLDLEVIAKIWRGGCIIRAKLLEAIREAFKATLNLPNLLLDPQLAGQLQILQTALREFIGTVTLTGVPTPALMSTLSYFDAYRELTCPANLIQAQRDYFGSHTYERIDLEGSFHTEWEKA